MLTTRWVRNEIDRIKVRKDMLRISALGGTDGRTNEWTDERKDGETDHPQWGL